MFLKIYKEAYVQELSQKIMNIREVNIDSKSGNTELVLFSKNGGAVRGVFDKKNKVNNYKISNEIYAYEVLSLEGRKFIEKRFRSTPGLNEEMNS